VVSDEKQDEVIICPNEYGPQFESLVNGRKVSRGMGGECICKAQGATPCPYLPNNRL